MNRIELVHLTLIGVNRPPASVAFGPHATIIRGPSDTGKTFIAEAIDYMLGASSLKEIPEREGYSDVLLGIKLPSGDVVTLSRAIGIRGFGLYEGDIRSGPLDPPAVTLKSKHSATRTDNISQFLLEQIGLTGRRVRKNANNVTESLSFRSIAPLCVIGETAMQAETSPALSGSYVDKTKEISVLKLLLQGEDDSHLTEIPSQAERKRLVNAQSEVIDRLLADLEEQLREAPALEELREQSGRLDDAIEEQSQSVEDLGSTRTRLGHELTQVERIAATARTALSEARSLTSRFELLSSQYEADLARLEMVSEAGSLLGFFNPGVCVFCGAEPEHQDLNNECDEDTTYFHESVKAERGKTLALRQDLSNALKDLADQRADLSRRQDRISDRRSALQRGLREVDAALGPQQSSLRELFHSRAANQRIHEVYEQVAKLQDLKVSLATESQRETASAIAGISHSAVEEFSAAIARRLEAWGVPEASLTRYDRNQQDIVTGDQLRSAHGKGVRAVLHAAFTVALADHCLAHELPHPGFVVLDSPLVTYRPPEPGETVADDDVLDTDVAARFYLDLEERFDGQVIILENTYPPSGMSPGTVDIMFTKNVDHGRFGFLPPVSAETDAR